MARQKKKAEPIVGFGKNPDEKLTVQKSTPLMSLWRSDMTLAQFKILDVYLSRINSHEPDKRIVQFEKGEIEKLLGVTKISQEDLESRIRGLGRLVPVEVEPGKFRNVGLFEEAYGEADEDGIWRMHLECTSKAMKYVFNVEKIGYLRYKLRCVTGLTSRYTYILFLYLEQNRFRKSWEVGVSDLRQILNCEKEATYTVFKRFNDLILKKAQKELKLKADYEFEYVPVKKGRSVVAVRFTVKTIKDVLSEACEDEKEIYEVDGEILEQTVIDVDCDEDKDLAKLENQYRRADVIGFGFDNELFDEFTDEELLELKDLAFRCVDSNDVDRHAKLCENRLDAMSRATAEYIVRKIKAMNVYDRRSRINNRYNYLKKSIQEDKKES